MKKEHRHGKQDPNVKAAHCPLHIRFVDCKQRRGYSDMMVGDVYLLCGIDFAPA